VTTTNSTDACLFITCIVLEQDRYNAFTVGVCGCTPYTARFCGVWGGKNLLY
jgi:hypothetical protein